MKNPLIIALAALMLSFQLYAQDKIGGNEPVGYYYSNSPDGSTSNPMQTQIQPAPNEVSAEKQQLLNQIRQARLNNNVTVAANLQKRLSEMSGSIELAPGDDISTGVRPGYQNENRPPFEQQGDYVVSTINSAGLWAIATATSPKSNAIFAAVSEYVAADGDIIRVYCSYNGGATWVLKQTLDIFVAEVDFRSGQLDIEPIINGSDTILFATWGYTFNSHGFVRIARFNIGANTNTTAAFTFGGYTSADLNYYNPRITSDNTNYAGATYVYLTVAMDSVNAANIKLKQRYGVILTPFTNLTVTYRSPNASQSTFWWHSSSAPAGTFLWQDICYLDAGSDRVYCVFNQSNLDNLYCAWSDDYGVSNTGNLFISETATIDRAIIAANGGTNQTLVIGYRRLFSGNDWDFRGQFTSTGGATTGSFTANYPDFTSNETKNIDVQAIKLANGRYVFGNTTTNNMNAYFRQTNSNTGASFGTIYQVNNVNADTSFGGIRVGYRNGGSSDSSMATWSHLLGAGDYCSYNIASTVGIINNGNEVPNVYSLSQNYPNPFNPVTNIKFSIPQTGLVKLIVYDIMGREVAQVINGNMNAGNYTADFNASSLSSGVYFYTLTAGDFKDTKKMILVK